MTTFVKALNTEIFKNFKLKAIMDNAEGIFDNVPCYQQDMILKYLGYKRLEHPIMYIKIEEDN